MNSKVGVAISTTGDEHRLELLARSIAAWHAALAERNAYSEGVPVFVTIDGDEAACQRVVDAVGYEPVEFYRVGQPPNLSQSYIEKYLNPKQGVAVNKNTGLELLMDHSEVEHLFLSDDDTWPYYGASLDKHVDSELAHSMVMWGKHRLGWVGSWAEWKWPRGVVLYQTRDVVNRVGGMDERFGPGGHEHVEYSQRIHNAGLTPVPFVSPASYATRNGMGARALWHAEDMPLEGEARHTFQRRKAALTTLRLTSEDWENINQVMASRQGYADYVSYRAHDNVRASATLCLSSSSDIPSQGAEESK